DDDADDHRQDRGRYQPDTEGDIEDPRRDRPEGDQLTVGEVRQAGRAEDQTQAHSGDRDDQTETQTVDDRAHQRLAPRYRRTATRLPEREDHRVRPSRSDITGHRGLDGDVVGQALGVDLEDVRARRNGEFPAPTVGVLRLGDHLAALGGRTDDDTVESFSGIVERSADD